jgi:hypothetical protein
VAFSVAVSPDPRSHLPRAGSFIFGRKPFVRLLPVSSHCHVMPMCDGLRDTLGPSVSSVTRKSCLGGATPTRLKHCRGRGATPSVRLRSNSLPAPPSDPSSLSLLLSPFADRIARHMPGYSAFPTPPSCPLVMGLLVAEAPAAALRGCRLACGLRGAWDTQHHKRRVRQANQSTPMFLSIRCTSVASRRYTPTGCFLSSCDMSSHF